MTLRRVTAKLRLAWAWFVDGLVEALIWAMRGGRRPVPFRLVVGESDGAVLNAEGNRVGRLVPGGSTPGIEPPDLARRLAGRDLDLVIPPAWMVRRSLEAVAAQSRPFLDVFVRHQIERISPWRADAVHHRVLVEPLPSDPTRLGVAVVLVPKRLVEQWLAPLEHLGSGSLRLCTSVDDGLAITVGGSEPGSVANLRRGVAWGLAGLATAAVLLCGVLQWEAGAVASDLEQQNSVLAERRIVLAKARQREGSDDDLSSRLLALRDARPSAVAIIDALAQAVPDSAHLTTLSIDKDGVSISGLSTDPSALVPALETSGHFADVVTSAATIRTESGDADRFSLSMRALLPSAPSPAQAAERTERKAGP